MVPFDLSGRKTLANVAKELDVDVSTVWRWVLRGVRGRKLVATMVGGRRYILPTDLENFLSCPASFQSRTASQRALDAGKLLDAAGFGERPIEPPPSVPDSA